MQQNTKQFETQRKGSFSKMERLKKELITCYNTYQIKDKFFFFGVFKEESIKKIVEATKEYLTAKHEYYSTYETENANIDQVMIRKQKEGIEGLSKTLANPNDDPKEYYYSRLDPYLYHSHFKSSQEESDFMRIIKNIFRRIFGCPTAYQIMDDVATYLPTFRNEL